MLRTAFSDSHYKKIGKQVIAALDKVSMTETAGIEIWAMTDKDGCKGIAHVRKAESQLAACFVCKSYSSEDGAKGRLIHVLGALREFVGKWELEERIFTDESGKTYRLVEVIEEED